MYLALVSLCVAAAPAEPARAAIVWLGDDEPDAALIEAARKERVKLGEKALSDSELNHAFVGTAKPRAPDIDAIERMIRDAREREANFDTRAANALRREVLGAFESAVTLSDRLCDAAASASQDLAAALFSDGDQQGAMSVARDTLRRFPRATLDPTRYPPAVQSLFQRAAASSASGPYARLNITSDVAGTLYVDCDPVGHLQDRRDLERATGRARVWLVHENRPSLPVPAEIKSGTSGLAITWQLDQRLRPGSPFKVECDDECAVALTTIGRRVGAARVVGVQKGGKALVVDTQSGKATSVTVQLAPPMIDVQSALRPEFASDANRFARFSYWYLAPFGVGQYKQKRLVFAASYLAVQAGLVTWNLLATRAHDNLVGKGGSRESSLRTQQNVSGMLFLGAVGAGVIEAVVVGLVFGQ